MNIKLEIDAESFKLDDYMAKGVSKMEAVKVFIEELARRWFETKKSIVEISKECYHVIFNHIELKLEQQQDDNIFTVIKKCMERVGL